MSFASKLAMEQAELDTKLKLLQQFPDLREHEDRWRHKRLCAKSANGQVNEILYKHTCGCCMDSPQQAWLFIRINDVQIFSDPPCFTILYRTDHGHDYYPREWENDVRAAGIQEGIITQLKDHVKLWATVEAPKKDEDGSW